jgi:flavin-dependent dehydrogenase
MSERREVIVVGAGPAGAATAAGLAALGHDVLLLDRAVFPRRKPCAECVNPAGVAALRRLGVWEQVLAEPHAGLAGWRIAAAGDEGFAGGFSDGEHGIGIARERLDHLLVRTAAARGAEVRTAHVTELLRADDGSVTGVRIDGADGQAEIAARLVVGADGLRSVVLRRLGLLRRRPRLRKLALTAHVEGWTSGSRGEVRLKAGGCVGMAPVGEGRANVTVVVPHARRGEVGGDVDAYFDAVLRREGLHGLRRVDAVLTSGPFDCPVRSGVADGALLVGDAAGYFDPFTGQGIYRALRGGELVTEAAHAALRSGDTSARGLAPYERARRAAFGPGERMQHLVEGFISRPWLLNHVSKRFRARPVLADALVRVTGDVAPAGSLFTPRFWAQMLF